MHARAIPEPPQFPAGPFVPLERYGPGDPPVRWMVIIR